MKKRLLSACLALALCLGLLPASALAATTKSYVLPMQAVETSTGKTISLTAEQAAQFPALPMDDLDVTLWGTTRDEAYLRHPGDLNGKAFYGYRPAGSGEKPTKTIVIPAYPQTAGTERDAWLAKWGGGVELLYGDPIPRILEEHGHGQEALDPIVFELGEAVWAHCFELRDPDTGALRTADSWTAVGLPKGLMLTAPTREGLDDLADRTPEGWWPDNIFNLLSDRFGAAIESPTVVLFGTPTVPGDYTVTLSAVWEGHTVTEKFLLTVRGQEYHTFNNSYGSFFAPEETERTNDPGNLYERLRFHTDRLYSDKDFVKSVRQSIQDFADDNWGGSCFGFAAVEGMYNTGLIDNEDLRKFDADAESLNDVSPAAEDTDVRNLLNYYLLSQLIPALHYGPDGGEVYYRALTPIPYSSWVTAQQRTGGAQLLALAEELAKKTEAGENVQLLLSYFPINGGGHAVIIDGARRLGNGGYELTLQDNRYHGYMEVERKVSGFLVSYEPTGEEVDPVLAIDSAGRATVSYPGGYGGKDGYVYSLGALAEVVDSYSVIDDFRSLASIFPQDPRYNIDISKPIALPVDPSLRLELSDLDGNVNWDNGVIEIDLSDWGQYPRLRRLPVLGTTLDGEDHSGVMVMLEEGGGSFTLTNEDGPAAGRFAYTGAEGYLRLDVESVESASMDADERTLSLTGNAGPFSLALGLEGDLTAVVEGSAAGDVAVAPAGRGVTVTAAEGSEIAVTFRSLSGEKETVSLTAAGGPVTAVSTLADQPEETLPFTDVKAGDWFYESVEYVYQYGLMTGTGGDAFSPLAPFSRAQVATVLHRLAGRPNVSGASPFADVAAGSWYHDAVLWASATGVAQGVGGELFAPDRPITREELAVFLHRFAQEMGRDVTVEKPSATSFDDLAETSDWAMEALLWAVDRGILQGSGGRLSPKAWATRAEAAAMLRRFCENV